eukprot:5868706-Prymnesium_polylepis.1
MSDAKAAPSSTHPNTRRHAVPQEQTRPLGPCADLRNRSMVRHCDRRRASTQGLSAAAEWGEWRT